MLDSLCNDPVHEVSYFYHVYTHDKYDVIITKINCFHFEVVYLGPTRQKYKCKLLFHTMTMQIHVLDQ